MNPSFTKVILLAFSFGIPAFLNAEQQNVIPLDSIELKVQTDLALPGKQAPLEIIQQTIYTLSISEEGVIVSAGAENAAIQDFLITDVPQGDYSLDALNSLQSQMVQALSSEGYFGIAVAVDPNQIDIQTGEDFRDGTTSLNLKIWLGVVVQQRTVSKGSRIKEGSSVNHPFQREVLRNSPLMADEESGEAGGFLIDKPALDDYLERLNQHPARRIDVALSSAGESGKIIMDYIVSESKPWTVYMQVSNTGTEATGEWRERIGGINYQLTGNDDILTVDYLTAEFDRANAFIASYERPVLRPDYLKLLVFGNYSDFAAENIEFDSLEDSTGETIRHGAELVYTPFYYMGHAISASAGLKYENIEFKNASAEPAEVVLSSPYLRFEASKQKQLHRSIFSIEYEKNIGTDDYDEIVLDGLGRIDSAVDHEILNFKVYQSFFIEPLLPGYYEVKPEKWLANSLVHELAFSFRGQYAFDDVRLITQKQFFGGGFFSVRGYNESAARGDSGFIGSAEYRIHLARLLRPSSLLEEIDPKEQASDAKIRNRFNYRAPSLHGLPDWNLLVRGFIDGASFSFNGEDNSNEEVEDNLLSIGLGFEFLYRANLNVRLDYGTVMQELTDSNNETDEDAEVGDSRFHFLVTYSF